MVAQNFISLGPLTKQPNPCLTFFPFRSHVLEKDRYWLELGNYGLCRKLPISWPPPGDQRPPNYSSGAANSPDPVTLSQYSVLGGTGRGWNALLNLLLKNCSLPSEKFST